MAEMDQGGTCMSLGVAREDGKIVGRLLQTSVGRVLGSGAWLLDRWEGRPSHLTFESLPDAATEIAKHGLTVVNSNTPPTARIDRPDEPIAYEPLLDWAEPYVRRIRPLPLKWLAAMTVFVAALLLHLVMPRRRRQREWR